jgi:rRNA processing protein Gar1
VTDSKGKTIGTIFDIFGPIKSPYVSIKPKVKNNHRLVNENLYIKRKKRRT